MSKSKRKLKQKASQGTGAGKPARGSKVPAINPDEPREYRRAAWKHFIRYFVSFTLLMLNVSIVMSFITRYMHHRAMDPIRELIFFAFVAFIDIFMFMPVIFEVNKVKTDAEAIGMSTLFWKTRIPWDKIIRFDQPPFLKFACLRTARCFYLINKRDISPFGELASVITAKMSSQPKQIQDGESYDL